MQVSGKNARIVIVVIGVVLFLLLFFADKTQLSGEKDLVSEKKPTTETTKPEVAEPSAPLSPDTSTDTWIEKSKTAKGKEKIFALDSVIAHLKTRKRFDIAVEYAQQKVQIEPNFQHYLQAGQLAIQALHVESVKTDTVAYRRFSNQSIEFLEKAVSLDAANEQAKIDLGTAYVESRKSENSMKGILMIREVATQNPNNAEAQFRLGLGAIQTGQWEKAEERFRNVVKLQAQNQDAKYYLALVLKELGKKEESNQLLKGILKDSQDPSLQAEVNRLLNL